MNVCGCVCVCVRMCIFHSKTFFGSMQSKWGGGGEKESEWFHRPKITHSVARSTNFYPWSIYTWLCIFFFSCSANSVKRLNSLALSNFFFMIVKMRIYWVKRLLSSATPSLRMVQQTCWANILHTQTHDITKGKEHCTKEKYRTFKLDIKFVSLSIWCENRFRAI